MSACPVPRFSEYWLRAAAARACSQLSPAPPGDRFFLSFPYGTGNVAVSSVVVQCSAVNNLVQTTYEFDCAL